MRVEHVIDTRESASHILAISHQIVSELEPLPLKKSQG